MKYIISIFLFVFAFYSAKAQPENSNSSMVTYTPDYKFKDGLYVSFEDFKNNSPIEKSKIIAPHLNRKDYNFIATLVEEKIIKIYDQLGAEKEIKPKNLWGFCDNGNIYINMDQNFSRLPYIGSLSHFVADKTTYNQNYNNPSYYNRNYYNQYNSYGQPTTTRTELYQYLLNMDTGGIEEYTLEAVEIALMKDPELHDEFMDLKRKKRRQKMFFYLRKYNQKNPLLVPKN